MNPNALSAPREMRGYTLLEAMIAVLIIGLLASVAAPSFKNARNNARDKQASIDTQLISGACEQLAWDTSLWPGGSAVSYTAQTLGPDGYNEEWDLNNDDAGLVDNGGLYDANEWKGPYISTIPVDPWGSKYFFDQDYTLVLEGNQTATVIGSFGVSKGTKNVYNDWRAGYTGRLDNIFDIIKRY